MEKCKPCNGTGKVQVGDGAFKQCNHCHGYGNQMSLTETEDFPAATLPVRADALMERMIAHGMSAITVEDYETIYQALEAACEIDKTQKAVALVRSQLGLPSPEPI